jgi:hypothetical protein
MGALWPCRILKRGISVIVVSTISIQAMKDERAAGPDLVRAG